MDVKQERLEDNKVRLDVEVDIDEVNQALEQAYKKVRKEVSLPGFRKGKVPRKVLEANYGKEVLHKDALDILIPQNYQKAIEEADIEPISEPEFEDFYIAEDEPATFTAIVEVKPDVELGEYTGYDVDREETEVTEEDIMAVLNKQREEQSQLVSVDRDEVQEGDHVIIDFEGFVDGEAFPGGSAEEFTLEIGSGQFIPGFEDQLIGKEINDEPYEVEVTFPEEYQAEDLAGQDAVFEVTIKEIKVKELPELDDEFAKDVSEFDTLDEFKEDIENRLKEQKENQAKRNLENEIIEKVSEAAEVEVSEQLIQNELDQMMQQMAQNLQQQGINIEDYFKYMGSSQDEWREENREQAADRAKNNLVLEAIAEEEGIEVTDEEIDDKLKEIADANDQDFEQVKAFMQMQGQLESLRNGLKMEKTIDFLIENN
ncbi:trigger factor [Halanaerobiaceae bacterium Z-7014]|uniref:Trigger factor n=1 Tax=Halonatronomonas betaini TaxID=2778430 RepID=A0A931FA21_9FIRM|nr:trigger factor [Halonatronomonas betaini]MBF8436482.1 trigger factor [Halonatronomonas betaini]